MLGKQVVRTDLEIGYLRVLEAEVNDSGLLNLIEASTEILLNTLNRRIRSIAVETTRSASFASRLLLSLEPTRLSKSCRAVCLEGDDSAGDHIDRRVVC